MYRRAIRRKYMGQAGAAPPQPAAVPGRSARPPLASLADVPSHAPPMIGAANDPAERQADAAADQVMRGGAPHAAAGAAPVAAIRREAKSAAAGAFPAGPAARGALASLGAGAPLPAAERAFFEPRFGVDLSAVRVHADRAGDTASRSIAARAFTAGTDIGFATGEYRPGTDAGRHLLAHELAHVVQGGGGSTVRRTPCKDAVPECEAKKKTAAEAKVADHPTYKSFLFGAATGTCAIPEQMAEKLKETTPGLFTGNASKYGDEVTKVNALDPTKIGPGKCIAFPVGWKDPNIGDIDAELKALRDKANVGLRNKVIAGVYAEMTLTPKDAPDADLQRAYILYSMLLRIRDERFKPKLADIAVSGTYHAIGSAGDYSDAVAYLEKPAAPAAKTLNTAGVDQVKGLVDTVSAATIPSDAGPYYFHWREGGSAETTTAKNEYAKQIKDGKKPAEAELAAANKQAAKIGVKNPAKWSKKIPGANKGKTDDRIGSMYIYK